MRNHELGCLVTATCCPTCCLQNQCTQLPPVRCHSGRHLCTNTGSLLCIVRFSSKGDEQLHLRTVSPPDKQRGRRTNQGVNDPPK